VKPVDPLICPPYPLHNAGLQAQAFLEADLEPTVSALILIV